MYIYTHTHTISQYTDELFILLDFLKDLNTLKLLF